MLQRHSEKLCIYRGQRQVLPVKGFYKKKNENDSPNQKLLLTCLRKNSLAKQELPCSLKSLQRPLQSLEALKELL